ncbi:MAG: protein kinase, partial [Acidobacteriota bacterium]
MHEDDAEKLPRLERFEVVEVLGTGGMGTVYKAWEPALKRYVALKFLRRDDPEVARRFALEAQAQARVEHDGICRVFDVGEAEGKPYIVMQYIAGKTLRQLRDELLLAEKLKLMKQVADAVHAAHREGLIHRDLKPGNIMVERTPEGVWKPYVLDFGLAQDQFAPGLTRTGMIMGTPQYMAPEQARGEVHTLDRRTDVYSLGAVLYELLGGEPPFAAATEVETLMRLVQEDPRPLRALAPRTPVDLETIVMKCLEKEPQRRYDSARALAEDLERYANGEPIMARRASWAYVLGKKARKHKAAVSVGAVALAVILFMLAVGVRTRLRAAERAALVQEFGQELERGESFLRVSLTLPLHDTRREVALMLERMKRIETTMKRVGRVAQGPGNYALGRAHLVLKEYAAARGRLEAAWSSGARSPEVAYALGQTLGELFQVALEESRRTASRELREARRAQLERELREPALAYLRQSAAGAGLAPAYVEGLVALYGQKWELALAKAEAAFAAAPWLWEAEKLRGDACVSLATARQDKGDFDGALAELERAGEAYRRASEIARSDASIFEAEAARCEKLMEIATLRGGEVAEAFKRAQAAIAAALQADPSRASAYLRRALIFHRLADAQTRRGEDPTASLDEVISGARHALDLAPAGVNAYQVLGTAYLLKAMQIDMRRGFDPLPNIERAAEALGKLLEANPGHAPALVNLGTAWALRVEHEIAHGFDPRQSLGEASKYYRLALDLSPEIVFLHNNLGNILFRRGEWEAGNGLDPTDSLREAIAACQKGLELNPNLAYFPNLMGAAYEALGRWSYAHGRDPRVELDQALSAYRAAIEKNPAYSLAHNNAGMVKLIRASYERET